MYLLKRRTKPKNFLSIFCRPPPPPPPRKRRKVRKIFGFCSRAPRTRASSVRDRLRERTRHVISPHSDCFGKKFGFCSGDTPMAAGLGFEPRYHAPEAWVLPLDDPAKLKLHSSSCRLKIQISSDRNDSRRGHVPTRTRPAAPYGGNNVTRE